MNNPEIIIIMPIYNAQSTVLRTIKSVLNQIDFNNYQLWCINDGSTDNTLSVLQPYKEHNNIVIINREHKGIIDTLNYGIINAIKCNPKYILRMDADDIMLNDRLIYQYNYMELHPECDILGGSVYINDNKLYDMGSYEITLQSLLGLNRIMHPTVCFRTESLKKLPVLYEEEYKYAEDYKLWVTSVLHGLRIFSDSYPVIYYNLYDKTKDYYDIQKQSAIKVQNFISNIIYNTTGN